MILGVKRAPNHRQLNFFYNNNEKFIIHTDSSPLYEMGFEFKLNDGEMKTTFEQCINYNLNLRIISKKEKLSRCRHSK